jgi:hypothetical protein
LERPLGARSIATANLTAWVARPIFINPETAVIPAKAGIDFAGVAATLLCHVAASSVGWLPMLKTGRIHKCMRHSRFEHRKRTFGRYLSSVFMRV